MAVWNAQSYWRNWPEGWRRWWICCWKVRVWLLVIVSIEEKQKGIKCLCDAFSAEQVDAIAVAIYNIEQKGQGCIIGDQTGIGKGRIAAGMIRYAVNSGLKPIFLTEKPNFVFWFISWYYQYWRDDAVPLDIFKGYRELKEISKNRGFRSDEIEEVEETEEEITVLFVFLYMNQIKITHPILKVKKYYSLLLLMGEGLKPM